MQTSLQVKTQSRKTKPKENFCNAEFANGEADNKLKVVCSNIPTCPLKTSQQHTTAKK
jgi:hypothetical protein